MTERILTPLSAAGLAALLVGLGFGRFAYTALVPGLIGEHWIVPGETGTLAAANFAGYLVGALAGAPIARRIGVPQALRLGMVMTALAFVGSALPFGFALLAFSRFLVGFTAAAMMVVAPPAILRQTDPRRRGRVAGVLFTGVGIGIAASGTLVPLLARWGVGATWLALAAVTAALALATWRAWPASPPPVPAGTAAVPRGLPPGFTVFLLGYCTDGAGFLPHTVYWVDWIARDLGQGLAAGGLHWTLFGLGAICGPLIAGRFADRFGFRDALAGALAIKGLAVALPLVSIAFPVLAVSSFVVGALTPAAATLASGRSGEISGPARHPLAWSLATAAFAATQALGALAFARLLALTGSHMALFAVGAAVLLLGAGLILSGRRPTPG